MGGPRGPRSTSGRAAAPTCTSSRIKMRWGLLGMPFVAPQLKPQHSECRNLRLRRGRSERSHIEAWPPDGARIPLIGQVGADQGSPDPCGRPGYTASAGGDHDQSVEKARCPARVRSPVVMRGANYRPAISDISVMADDPEPAVSGAPIRLAMMRARTEKCHGSRPAATARPAGSKTRSRAGRSPAGVHSFVTYGSSLRFMTYPNTTRAWWATDCSPRPLDERFRGYWKPGDHSSLTRSCSGVTGEMFGPADRVTRPRQRAGDQSGAEIGRGVGRAAISVKDDAVDLLAATMAGRWRS